MLVPQTYVVFRNKWTSSHNLASVYRQPLPLWEIADPIVLDPTVEESLAID